MIPLDGEIRSGVGLLGSPSFEIPRTVERDQAFDYLTQGDELRRRLRAKNWHNLRTMGIFLLGRWLHFFLVTVFALAALDAYGGFAQLQMAAFFALSVLVTPVYFVLLERAIKGFRRLEPKYCSIYDPYFWRHERLWKVPGEGYLHMFDGTPFKNLIWRGLGVRIGKRVFDDGCYITERTLTTIGDDVMLNAGTQDPVPLAGGRHLQVRPDHDRRRLHHRGRRDDPLRRDDGRPLGARPRLLPDERRGNPAARTVGRKPGEGDVT